MVIEQVAGAGGEVAGRHAGCARARAAAARLRPRRAV